MPKKSKAVALKYNIEQDLAPVVIASGYGEVAERIINIAEERGIPVYRDDSAASMLCMLEVGASIPEDLYQVVATIYIQIMETANRIKEGVSDTPGAAAKAAGGRAGRGFNPSEATIGASVTMRVADEGGAMGVLEAAAGRDPAQAAGVSGEEGDGFKDNFVARAREASQGAPEQNGGPRRLSEEQIVAQVRRQLGED